MNNKKIIFFFRKFGGIENLLFGQNREIPIYLFHLQMPRLCQLRRGTFYLQASRNLWLSDKSDHQVYSQPSNNPGQTRFVLSFRVPHTNVHTAPVRLSPGKVDKVEAVLWRDQRHLASNSQRPVNPPFCHQTPLLILSFVIRQIRTIISAKR